MRSHDSVFNSLYGLLIYDQASLRSNEHSSACGTRLFVWWDCEGDDEYMEPDNSQQIDHKECISS